MPRTLALHPVVRCAVLAGLLGSLHGVRAQEPADHPVDLAWRAALAERGLTPSPPADDVAWIRRLHWTLHGLPPDAATVERWRTDAAPDRHERWVDAALASPRFGEHLARHWLDLVHWAETSGFETNVPRPGAHVYRDWVIEAFDADLPYTAFFREQIAGDLGSDDRATGFLVTGPYDGVRSPDPVLTAQQRSDELADLVGTVGTTFLGTTLGCARCHDHPFDPIAQEDYYAVEALFAGVQHAERELRIPEEPARATRLATLRARFAAGLAQRDASAPLAQVGEGLAPRRPPVDPLGNVERFAPILARSLRFVVEETSDGAEPCLDELEVFAVAAGEEPPRNVAHRDAGAAVAASSSLAGHAIHRLEHVNDGRIGNAWSWISAEGGRGWVEVTFARPAVVDLVLWARDRTGRYRDRLATGYRVEVSVDGATWHTVASSGDRVRAAGADAVDAAATYDAELARLRDELLELSTPRRAYVGAFAEPPTTRLLFRGDPQAPRQIVAPDLPRRFGSLGLAVDASEAERRAAFASWLADPRQRRPARVLANRVWQWVFGTGLVATPNDHGRHGSPPSHPELLERLTDELLANGGSIKRLIRLLVTSQAFRQSSVVHAEGQRRDAANTLLWRFPARRVSAEMLRDGILSVAGTLDLARGGPGFAWFEPNDNYVRVYEPRAVLGPEAYRRMIYAIEVRMEKDDVFGAFDRPDGARSTPVRTRSTTPVQAANLSHARFVFDQAEWFERRVLAEVGADPRGQVVHAFRTVLSREPDAVELAAAEPFVRRHGLAALARVLWNANEFVVVP